MDGREHIWELLDSIVYEADNKAAYMRTITRRRRAVEGLCVLLRADLFALTADSAKLGDLGLETR
jgi:hypothetical protein